MATLEVRNQTDGTSNQVGEFHGNDRSEGVEDDEAYFSFYLDGDEGDSVEVCRLIWQLFVADEDAHEGCFLFQPTLVGNLITRLQIGGQGPIFSVDSAVIITGRTEIVDSSMPLALRNPGASTTEARLMRLEGTSAFTAADGDSGLIECALQDSGGDFSESARLKWIALDVTNTSKDGAFAFLVQSSNTLTEIARIAPEGVLIGTTTRPTANAGKVLVFGDNSSDPTMGSSTGGIYAKDVSGTVEMFAIDSANNATQLSSHDSKNRWVFRDSRNGVRRQIDMERLIALVERLTGESLWQDEWS